MTYIFKLAQSFLKRKKKQKQEYFIENGKKYKLILVGIEILKVEIKQ